MNCQKCGTEIPNDAKVCYKCKTIQPNARLCSNCKKVIDKRYAVCPKCGKKVVPIQQQQPQPKKLQTAAKKHKKPILKKWWFWAITAILVIGIIGSVNNGRTSEGKPENSSKIENDVEPSQNPNKPSTESKPTESSQEEPQETGGYALGFEATVALWRIALAENFGENNYELEYDDMGMTVNLWADNIALGAAAALGGSQEAKEAWDFVVESQTSLCNQISESIEDTGKENYYIMLNVLNDMDKSKTLLSVLNGVVIYDAVNDQT